MAMASMHTNAKDQKKLDTFTFTDTKWFLIKLFNTSNVQAEVIYMYKWEQNNTETYSYMMVLSRELENQKLNFL